MMHTRELESIEEEVQNDDKLMLIVINSTGVASITSRLVLPATSGLIPKFIREFHSLAMGGHSGFFHTYMRLAVVLFWEGMKCDI